MRLSDQPANTMDFGAYDLDHGIYDEMFLSDGTPRNHSKSLYETLQRISPQNISSIQDWVTRSFLQEGIS